MPRHRRLTAAVCATVLAMCVACGGPGSEPSKDLPAATSVSGQVDPAGFGPPQGAGCTGVPNNATSKGTFAGMAKLPVSEAIALSPVLRRFNIALQKVPDVVARLDKATEVSLFIPADSAFRALGAKKLTALFKDDKKRNAVVAYTIVPQRVVPPDLLKPATALPTLAGPDKVLTVTSAGGVVTLNGRVHVVCSNILTANATIYVVDGVLNPLT